MSTRPKSKLVIFFGALCSGKGTQARLLKDFHAVSAGDTLREASKTNPKLAKILSNGKLVPEHITEEFLTDKIDLLCKNVMHQNILLEGYPRSYYQSQVVEKWMKRKFGFIQFELKNVLGFHLLASQAEILERLDQRWICNSTGRTYHTKYNPPRVQGLDDDTSEPLMKRSDDLNPEAIKNRLETYSKETLPVIEIMRAKGYKILDVPSGSIQDIHKQILEEIKFI